MKKHFTHLFTFLLIALTNFSFAQVDWAIKSIKSPTELESTNNEKAVDLIWWNQQKWNVSVHNVAYNSDNIAVYPNPANDQLNVQLIFAESNAVNIELLDLSGKMVASPNKNQAISPNQFTLDVTDLSKGIYILKVTNGTKVSTSKVTISH
jgi:hypothetical protein